jgi:nitroreductase
MTVSQALEHRRAQPFYDPGQKIELSEILAIIEKATLTPSSQNLQPWEVLICLSDEDKKRLQEVSYNQKKITDASAVLVILGDLWQHLHAARVAEGMIETGYLTPERQEAWVAGPAKSYATSQRRRDEAFRGASLFGMSLMLIAEEAGWSTAPMGGFEPAKLAQAFGLPRNVVPVMLICLGKPDPDKSLLPRQPRFSAREISSVGRYGEHPE